MYIHCHGIDSDFLFVRLNGSRKMRYSRSAYRTQFGDTYALMRVRQHCCIYCNKFTHTHVHVPSVVQVLDRELALLWMHSLFYPLSAVGNVHMSTKPCMISTDKFIATCSQLWFKLNQTILRQASFKTMSWRLTWKVLIRVAASVLLTFFTVVRQSKTYV